MRKRKTREEGRTRYKIRVKEVRQRGRGKEQGRERKEE